MTNEHSAPLMSQLLHNVSYAATLLWLIQHSPGPVMIHSLPPSVIHLLKAAT